VGVSLDPELAPHPVRRRGGETRGARPAGRVPPHDLDAERAVLSAILLDNNAIHTVYTEIKADDFYHPAHQTLYRAMVGLKEANQPVDLTTLADHLSDHKLLDAVGGAVALAELADYEATPANVLHYARIVADKSLKRSLISTAGEIVELAYELPGSADELLDASESRIFALGQAKARTTLSPIGTELHATIDYVEALMDRSGEPTGVQTGFRRFDDLTGGLQAGDLFVLAARPSMGKTALALNIAENAALHHQKRIAIFSLEMTCRSLILRLLSGKTRTDLATFRRGLIGTDLHKRIIQAANELAQANIWIDDTSSLTVLEIRAKSRRLHAQHGLDLVVVDYLQLCRADHRTDSREQEIAEISRGLKGLAKELEIPVIALAQLNRGPETRKAEEKRPILADLRESGAIEQDADVIAFIYRDVVYHPEDHPNPDQAELIIRKQRNGPTDTVYLRFDGRYARFEDWAGPEEGPHAGGFGARGGASAAPGPAAGDPFRGRYEDEGGF
jgi:replicative DNA helicase